MTGRSPIQLALLAALAALMLLPGPFLLAADQNEESYQARRGRMVDVIERQFAATPFETESRAEPERRALSKRVATAMKRVPRHAFVPESQKRHAYENRPLPIGHRQTISQPYIVALMTELLDLEQDDKVFEVGTGSGYQAAVLSELVSEVYTIEIVAPLGKLARERLVRLGYKNVKVRVGDGYNGWPAAAPFDAIIVTAGADHIPAPLIDQLKPGGRMIIPVGGLFRVQHLILLEKSSDGSVTKRRILPVRFVPLTRKLQLTSASTSHGGG